MKKFFIIQIQIIITIYLYYNVKLFLECESTKAALLKWSKSISKWNWKTIKQKTLREGPKIELEK